MMVSRKGEKEFRNLSELKSRAESPTVDYTFASHSPSAELIRLTG